MFQLNYHNQSYSSLSDFKAQKVKALEFLRVALDFCKEWLEGKETFEQKTSGSTGIPKHISISRAQMTSSARATQGFFQTDDQTKLACCLSPEYIAGKMMLVRAMVWNCKIELLEPSSNPLSEITEIPDFVAMVPLQMEQSLEDSKSLEKLKQIKHIIIGGAPISESLKSQIIDQGILAYQTYGMTETVSHIALAKITSGELRYHTLPGVQIGLDDRDTLWIKSPIAGPKPIQSNDLVELYSDNSFRWLGRLDFVINTGGVKIHPELLELKAASLLQTVFPETPYFFAGIEDQKLGNKVILLLESDFPGEKAADDLKELLKKKLNRFENPKEIFFMKDFIRTPNGKLDRLRTIEKL